MLGKVKQFFGIEGVKVEILLLREEVRAREGLVVGSLRFYSMHTQTVTQVRVVLIEKYSRGRGKEKLIDEYELGEFNFSEPFEVPAGEAVELDFELPFRLVKSEMDEFGDRNFFFKGIASAAKKLNAVQSYYRLEATAKVRGTALSPFTSRALRIR